MSEVAIVVEFNQLPFIKEWNGNVSTALVRALNDTAARSRTDASRRVRQQVNFPASYLSPSAKRLWVKTKARKNALQTVIEGRGNPTSLARFSKQSVLPGGKRHKGGKVNVTVHPGETRSISRAFLIRLRNGNTGLAIRTDGSKPKGAWMPRALGKNLWLLYGPSVDQVLSSSRNEKGVLDDMTPEMLDYLEKEFNRQMELLNG